MVEEQEFCLRWNNFQANITSQFEALRVDQDFTDVSIVCDKGVQIQAHRVVLSACSPLFKELFKKNPCTHPIIFMRDVDEYSVRSLLMFMYAGEVNVAQAHFSNFLRTAESLQIRGLTEPSGNCLTKNPPFKDTKEGKPEEPSQNDAKDVKDANSNNETNVHEAQEEINTMKQMKIELPEFADYFSDVEEVEGAEVAENITEDINLDTLGYSHMEPVNNYKTRSGQSYGTTLTRSKLSKSFRKRAKLEVARTYQASSIDTCNTSNSNDMIQLADGIEVHSEQLRGMKWNDYKKLTRGLATILFRPEELASCSVTGQRWSRAGSDLRRPVKPALDRAKVQAIISYVATRFPMIEVSRIKQVLAYKCKEHSTAFKMKAVRYFADQVRGSSTA